MARSTRAALSNPLDSPRVREAARALIEAILEETGEQTLSATAYERELKRLGRLRILRGPVFTSPRKLNDYSMAYFGRLCLRAVLSPARFARDRSLLGMWYDHRSEEPHSGEPR